MKCAYNILTYSVTQLVSVSPDSWRIDRKGRDTLGCLGPTENKGKLWLAIAPEVTGTQTDIKGSTNTMTCYSTRVTAILQTDTTGIHK